jgi:hypothetical protein
MLKVGVVGLERGMSHFDVYSQRNDTKVMQEAGNNFLFD